MAKKAKKKKVIHRRKSRVKGMSDKLTRVGMMFLGGIAGGGVETFINQAVKTALPTAPTWMGGAAGVAGGVATLLFAPEEPFFDGAAIGLITMGGVFALNETFLSLPGISGIPKGVPNAVPGQRPGYLKHAVNGSLKDSVGSYNGIPKMGNLSNADTVGAVGTLYRN